jgi:hypothetical protein
MPAFQDTVQWVQLPAAQALKLGRAKGREPILHMADLT